MPEREFVASAEPEKAPVPELELASPPAPQADAAEDLAPEDLAETEEPESSISQELPTQSAPEAEDVDLRKRAAALQEAESIAAQLFASRTTATLASPSAQGLASPPAQAVAAPEELFAAPHLQSDAAPWQPNLEDWLTPNSCKQIESLASAMLSPLPAGAPAALAVAAVDAWQDAAGIARRLAWRLAERKQGDVLLIQRDLIARKAERSALSWGLSDVVTGRAEWSEAISPTEVAGLYLLGPGSPLPPEDTPSREQWRSAMKQFKERFRFIATDFGPELGAEDGDWASVFDGVYLAVQLHRTPRAATDRAAAALKRSGAAVRGSIALD